MTTITDIADQARALTGRPVTIYTHHEQWGTVADQGLLGHVHEDLYLTLARDRTERGLPPEMVRVMLANVLAVHETGQDAVPADAIQPGHVLTEGPVAGAEITGTQAPEEFGGGVVRLTARSPQGTEVSVYTDAATRLT